jgi:hypothetical protein
MKNRGSSSRGKTEKVLFGGILLFAVLFCCRAVGADEEYGMPSEQEARQHGYTSAEPEVEQVVGVESIRKEEDRLFLNGEPFVLKRDTRFLDERGARIQLEDIPLGARIEVKYHKGSGLEDSGYGPEEKLLTTIRLVQPPPGKKPLR